jgi:hypothetical protein
MGHCGIKVQQSIFREPYNNIIYFLRYYVFNVITFSKTGRSFSPLLVENSSTFEIWLLIHSVNQRALSLVIKSHQSPPSTFITYSSSSISGLFLLRDDIVLLFVRSFSLDTIKGLLNRWNGAQIFNSFVRTKWTLFEAYSVPPSSFLRMSSRVPFKWSIGLTAWKTQGMTCGEKEMVELSKL